MKVMQEVRGSFRCINKDLATDSIVTVTGLDLPPNNVFVMSYNVTKSEKRGIVQCFNNVNHVYAFGPDPEASNYSVSYGVFLQEYPGCSDRFRSGGALADMLDQYRKLRVSSPEGRRIVSMTIDTGAMVSGILTGCRIDVQDAQINLFTVTLIFTDLDADEESGGGK